MSRSDIRQAASVIAARDGDGRVEVLVIERGPDSRFLPRYIAFPGGSTDAEDARHAERWFGDAAEAARASAVRELAEEVAFALTEDGLVTGRLADVDHSPPHADQLTEIAHWVAPNDVPVRFDALYFAVAAPSGLDPVPDGHETVGAWWRSPSELLEDWEAQRRKLYWPTYFTMTRLARCKDFAEVRALRIDTREPDDGELEYLHRSTFFQE